MVLRSGASRKRLDWRIFAALGAILVLAWACVVDARALDFDIFVALMRVLGQSERPAAVLSNPTSLEVASWLLLAAVSLYAGKRLPDVPRIVTWLQLFAMSILVQWALWAYWHVVVHPLGFFACLAMGGLAGWLFRLGDKKESAWQAQFYELMLRNRELKETKLQLVKQDEVERRILAGDLHDQVLNDLKNLRQQFQAYARQPTAEVARAIEDMLGRAMNEIREVMDSLCPSALEHLGPAAAFEDCLRRGAERGGFKARFRNSVSGGELGLLSMVEQSLLYRIVQETITNICKHAGAQTVRMVVSLENAWLTITISDDGCGLNPDKLQHESRGIRYMRQRADLLGATLSWSPAESGRGTKVEIRMDLTEHLHGQSSSG